MQTSGGGGSTRQDKRRLMLYARCVNHNHDRDCVPLLVQRRSYLSQSVRDAHPQLFDAKIQIRRFDPKRKRGKGRASCGLVSIKIAPSEAADI